MKHALLVYTHNMLLFFYRYFVIGSVVFHHETTTTKQNWKIYKWSSIQTKVYASGIFISGLNSIHVNPSWFLKINNFFFLMLKENRKFFPLNLTIEIRMTAFYVFILRWKTITKWFFCLFVYFGCYLIQVKEGILWY